jgi:hypothetical protein
MMRIISILIILGSLLFLSASFSPISAVHMEPTAAGKLALINASPGAWLLSQILYSLGAVLVASAIAGVVYRHRQSYSPALTFLIYLSLLVGALFFLVYAVFRTTNPQAWVQITPPHPQFLGYTFLTQLGLLLFGAALLKAGYPSWLGWLLVSSMIVLFVLTVVFRDMPPFAYYLLALIVGVALFIRNRKESMAAVRKTSTAD